MLSGKPVVRRDRRDSLSSMGESNALLYLPNDNPDLTTRHRSWNEAGDEQHERRERDEILNDFTDARTIEIETSVRKANGEIDKMCEREM